ncbi:MAG: Gfo/Idh/MocA family oxidoreductase [Planctomycetota bacterium]
MARMKIIIVGTGNRGLGCFAKGLMGFPGKGLPEFPTRAEIAAFVDTNLTRAKASAKEANLPELPVFRDVAEAQSRVKADWAIVTTPDFTHREGVIRALDAGLNVLVDKPLATSAWECDLILAAMKRAGRQVRVGHNMRYHAETLRCAKLVREGAIGEVLHVEAAEVLDYGHGGDYFHRWHSDFSRSAGLMNHKACHHMDFLLWVLDDAPVEASARGGRCFYRERKDLAHGSRCSGCGIAKTCPHYFNIDKWDGVYRRIYKEAEGEDGYVRDACVFSERHTINDHEAVILRTRKGALVSFNLLTFSPREFSYFYFTGTKGRLEYGTNTPDGSSYLRLIPADGKVADLLTKGHETGHTEDTGHGGSDCLLIADLLGLPGADPLMRAAPEEARRAVLVADLASRSIAAGGRVVKAEEAGKDFPPAPPR